MNLPRLLQTAIYARVPLLICGPPGCGKTSIVRRTVADMGKRLWTLIASYREPADFGGLPVVRREPVQVDGNSYTVVELAPPRYAVEAASDPDGGVIFLDEITCTPPAVQAPLLRMVHELVVGELELPADRVAVVAAANPPEQAAGGWDLAPPLANRFAHVQYNVNVHEWKENFPSYWGKAPALCLWGRSVDHEHWARKRALIAAFIHHRSGRLMEFPKDAGSQGLAWPSPRSWDNVSRLLTVGESFGLAKDELAELTHAAVGTAAASEFCSWAEHLDLPDPEALLANPDGWTLPARGDQQYAALAAVAGVVVARNTPERWRRAWMVMVYAAKSGAPDIAAAAARMLATNRPPRGASVPLEADKCFRPMLEQAGLLGGKDK